MSHGIPFDQEPLPAAVNMHPAFLEQTLGVFPVKQVVRPFSVIQLGRIWRTSSLAFAAKMKFSLVSYAAIWTGNSKHLQYIIVNIQSN